MELLTQAQVTEEALEIYRDSMAGRGIEGFLDMFPFKRKTRRNGRREVALQCGVAALFLIRNNGEKVAISSLDGRKFGLFLSEIHYDRIVTDDLIKVYNQLSSEGRDFEIVFVSCDSCEETFNMYFSDMPWLAVPFADSDTRERLHDHFGSFTEYYPDLLVIYDAAIGMVVNEEGLELWQNMRYYELEAAAKKEQSLRSLLVSSSRDYLISNDGSKVAVSDLEGKIVAFYFWFNIPDKDGGPDKLTRVLAEIYRKLKEAGESFEVVLVPLDDNKSSYEQGLASMPWLAIPFEDEGCERLIRYFELWPFHLPTVLVIGADGKIMLKNYDSLIDDYGVLAWEAFPFSEEQLDLLPEKARAAQTLESLLVAGDLDYVIGKEGLKVPVKELVGKTILLFFAMNGSIWCQKFLPMLIEAYHKIKRMDSAFEVIYVPMGDMNTDPGAFEFFLRMPWLAVPVGDERIGSLENTLEVGYVNTMVVIGPTGQTITNNAATSLEVPVKELVGKTILLFFSARGSGTCRGFLPHLIEEYHKIKRMDSAFEVVNISMDSAFEVVNISMDKDQDSFEEFFSGMPWLALPFGDERKKSLERTFGGGRTSTRYATRSLATHGADAYPFSEERMKELDQKIDEMAKGWPEKRKHELHKHRKLELGDAVHL
ncbi:protein-disulfide reductase [Musa troglodytarum]|uniref:protein-disulfide reductase n=1 Tax=Musa troglodytarum TaxID=320322 RepID=A0A9E7KAT2_9LILI|nr:protein-disulfide reductase [Musa troglodytarum]